MSEHEDNFSAAPEPAETPEAPQGADSGEAEYQEGNIGGSAETPETARLAELGLKSWEEAVARIKSAEELQKKLDEEKAYKVKRDQEVGLLRILAKRQLESRPQGQPTSSLQAEPEKTGISEEDLIAAVEDPRKFYSEVAPKYLNGVLERKMAELQKALQAEIQPVLAEFQMRRHREVENSFWENAAKNDERFKRDNPLAIPALENGVRHVMEMLGEWPQDLTADERAEIENVIFHVAKENLAAYEKQLAVRKVQPQHLARPGQTQPPKPKEDPFGWLREA
jgi:hypothetical protein